MSFCEFYGWYPKKKTTWRVFATEPRAVLIDELIAEFIRGKDSEKLISSLIWLGEYMNKQVDALKCWNIGVYGWGIYLQIYARMNKEV